jgi:hypothetical protein
VDVGVPLMGGTVSAWTSFNDSVEYLSNDPIAYYSIELFLFHINGQASINAHLDDLSFDGITSVIPAIDPLPYKLIKESENVYLIEMDVQKKFSYDLYTAGGSKMTDRSNVDLSGIRINLNDLDAGIYICKLYNGNYQYSIKLLRN